MTELETSTTAVALADRYLAAWNATDADSRNALIAEAWEPDGTYLDPMFASEGRAGISEMIAGFLAAYPGHTFTRVGEVEEHHDKLRFRWQLANADREVQMLGTDIATRAPSGLLAEIVGFFDSPQPQ
ncbi:MAG: nuclear transport factor 2 family protein [Thermomicrobiales bacterium]